MHDMGGGDTPVFELEFDSRRRMRHKKKHQTAGTGNTNLHVFQMEDVAALCGWGGQHNRRE